MSSNAEEQREAPVINARFISHGTLTSKDLDASRRFYESFFGFEVVRTSPISLMLRLGGDHVYVVVKKTDAQPMPRINHNGVDVPTDADVDEAHRRCVEQAQKWGLTNISEPKAFHGTYSFHLADADGNDWEILSNPAGGYKWIFEKGDLTGRGHMDKEFRHGRPDAPVKEQEKEKS